MTIVTYITTTIIVRLDHVCIALAYWIATCVRIIALGKYKNSVLHYTGSAMCVWRKKEI